MRRCQRIGCPNSLDSTRPDARYCGATCKREAARTRAPGRDGSAAPAFWDAYRLVRRRSRCTTRETTVRGGELA